MTGPRRTPRRRAIVATTVAAPLIAIGSLTAVALAQTPPTGGPVPAAAFRFAEEAARDLAKARMWAGPRDAVALSRDATRRDLVVLMQPVLGLPAGPIGTAWNDVAADDPQGAAAKRAVERGWLAAPGGAVALDAPLIGRDANQAWTLGLGMGRAVSRLGQFRDGAGRRFVLPDGFATSITAREAGLRRNYPASDDALERHDSQPIRLADLVLMAARGRAIRRGGLPSSVRALQAFRIPAVDPMFVPTVQRALALRPRSTEQLRLGRIKVVADGSIQGFSARLRWPGYYNGAPNGLWYTPPETVRQAYTLALAQGVQIHTHTNGDEATEMVLDQLEAVLRTQPGPDHRFILQHCQLADAAQFRRMKALGMGVNLFANHHFYWGDQHRDVTVGPERAERMNACRTALDTGVPFSIHSDAPITPLAPLFTAWCAVNRLTASGRVLGATQRINVMDALRAVTLGAAWTLKLDGEIGSIECGKRADFCVLEDDPTEVGAERLKDVRVWGTVQGGRVFAAA